MGRKCQFVLDDRDTYPEALDMFQYISENMQQIRNAIVLIKQNKTTMLSLEERQTQLENGKKQRDLLVSNMAHQVARPITELKYAAYQLSQGFTREAYLIFRAALVEVERGARNFTNFEKLTEIAERAETSTPILLSYDIVKVLETARKRIKPLLETTKRTLVMRVKEHSLPRLKGDSNAILECFLNVIHNAIKYSTCALPVEIEVDYSKASRRILVRVMNSGIELPSDDWERVFEPTTRSETAKQLAIEGAGLGLYITRQLLRLFDGTIRVESCRPWCTTVEGSALWRTTFLVSLEVLRR